MTDPAARDLIQRLLTVPGEDYMGTALEAEARAYLATPEPAAGPTDEELLELWTAWNVGWDPRRGPVVMPHPAEYARAVLTRFGNQPPQPIPLRERLPGPEDCDAEGCCWFLEPGACWWQGYAEKICASPYKDTYTHWLPSHALPLPEEKP